MALQAFGRRIGNAMRSDRREPTMTELLSDPIIIAVMKADRVDPIALEAQLRSMTQSSAATRHVPFFR